MMTICPRCRVLAIDCSLTYSPTGIQETGECPNCGVDVYSERNMRTGRISSMAGVELFSYYFWEIESMCIDCEREKMERAQNENNGKTLYAVLGGAKDNYYIVALTPNKALSQYFSSRARGSWIKEFECHIPTMTEPFPVYVVSIGIGKQYRIVKMVSDKKTAGKIAASVRGKVSVFDAMPSELSRDMLTYRKYFIPLGDDRERNDPFFFVDRFRRRVPLYENQDPPCFITRRRRYNSSLPYRLEVAAVDERLAHTVAQFFSSQVDSGELDVRLLEYNVDYLIVKNGDKWEVDPCLLEAVSDT